MKALHCLDCEDMVVAFAGGRPRSCNCRRHVIWSTKPRSVSVAVLDRKGTRDRAFLIRISNVLARYKGETTRDVIRALQKQRIEGDTFFKEQHSLVVMTVIGAHPDSVWADSLPTGLLSEAPIGRRTLLGRVVAALLRA